MQFGLLKKYILITLILILFAAIGAYALRGLLSPQAPTIDTSPGAPRELPPPVPPKPSVSIESKDKKTVIVRWANLPEGADWIQIFRSKTGQDWTKWKTVSVSGTNGTGYAEVTLSMGEGGANYQYYFEVNSSAGESLLNTSSTPTTAITAPPPAPTSTAPSAPGSNPTPTTPDPNTTQPTSTPSSTAATTPSETPASSESTSTQVYYTPDGQISGTSSIQTGDFWVMHVNKNIEVGWKNLPTATNNLIIYRGTAQSGPWDELLKQTNPLLNGFIRLVDHTLQTNHYYRMEAREGTQILKSVGPMLLAPLE